MNLDSQALPSGRSRPGYTLIELLVVIAIIMMLAGLLLGALFRARGRALKDAANQEFQQIKGALELYKTDFGSYPPDDQVAVFSSAATPVLSYEAPAIVDGSAGSLGSLTPPPASPNYYNGSEIIGSFLCQKIIIGPKTYGPYIQGVENRLSKRGTHVQLMSSNGGYFMYQLWVEANPALLRTSPRPQQFLLMDPGPNLLLGPTVTKNADPTAGQPNFTFTGKLDSDDISSIDVERK